MVTYSVWIKKNYKNSFDMVFFFIFISCLFVEEHEELQELIHDLDVWHKSAKLVKALTDVSNFQNVLLFPLT